MPINQPPARAVDITPLRVALRALMLTSGVITGIVGQRVTRDMDVTDNLFPYIAITKVSAVPMNTQTSSGINALMDIRCVDSGTATNGDTAAPEISRLVVDTDWAVPGYDVIDKQWVADIGKSYVQESQAYYEGGHRFRVLLRKQ